MPASINRERLVAAFPKRQNDSHKGMFGTVAIIGGTTGMVGAALLAGRAALKLGAGCVHVGLLAENAPTVDPVQLELMLHKASDLLRYSPLPNPLPIPSPQSSPASGRGGEREKQSLIPVGEGASEKNFGFTVLAVGCGLGQSTAALELLRAGLAKELPLVLDADALNLLALHPKLHTLLAARKSPTVLTPHPGEAARLLGSSTAEVQAGRIAAVRQLAQRYSVSVVLKGADSLCVTRDGRLFVNHTGNPGMSSAGMGDVLTGMVAAFIAQGMDTDAALLLAVHLHGAAGDELAKQKATIGMTATEVTEWARWLLNQWVSN